MAVLTDYKGIDVVEGATGAGGAALTNDFRELADRAPRNSVLDPGATDDVDAGFFPGSLWFNVATETMWVCTSATADAPVWKSFYTRDAAGLTLIPEENNEAVIVVGDLGVGTDSPKARLHAVGSTIVGADVAAVADGDLGTSQVNVWLDETGGSEKLKFKAKLSGGSVKSGEVSLNGTVVDLSTVVILSPATSARNVITPSAASAVPLTLKGAASQSANLQEWQDSGGTAVASITANGAMAPASMADASAANGTIYYSTTAGKLVFKDSGGTVNSLY